MSTEASNKPLDEYSGHMYQYVHITYGYNHVACSG